MTGSFGNYALAQLRRLQNALYRDIYTEAEKRERRDDFIFCTYNNE